MISEDIKEPTRRDRLAMQGFMLDSFVAKARHNKPLTLPVDNKAFMKGIYTISPEKMFLSNAQNRHLEALNRVGGGRLPWTTGEDQISATCRCFLTAVCLCFLLRGNDPGLGDWGLALGS